MKSFICTVFLVISYPMFSQNESLDNWIQNIVKDMIEMNNLDKYSVEELSPVLDVNFVMVESVKDITVNSSLITMLVNHGKGTYCTELTFKYVEESENYYLVFSEPETKITLGTESKWVTPWIEKKKICD